MKVNGCNLEDIVLNEENYAQKAKVWMFSLICGREDGE
jgi:hypothetical protein